MPAAIFGERGHTQVDTVFDGPLRKGAKQRVVDNDEGAVALLCAKLVGNANHQVEVDDRRSRVGWRLRDDKLQWPLRHRFVGSGANARLIGAVHIRSRVRAELRHDAVVQHIDAAIYGAAVDHAVTGADMSKSNTRMRRHTAAIGDRFLGAINRRQPLFEEIQTRMAKSRINVVGFANQRPGSVEKCLMYILGVLRRRVNERRCHEDRRLYRTHAHFGVIAIRDRKSFGTESCGIIHCHALQYSRGPCRNNSR